MNSNTIPAELKKYGKVEKFELFEDKVYIRITTGFDPRARNTFACFSEIEKITNEAFPYAQKVQTDHNLFEAVLSKFPGGTTPAQPSMELFKPHSQLQSMY